MMQQMQTSWDDIEVSEHGLGFDDLSFEGYRQDLLAEIQDAENKYKQMPKGIYTGFNADKSICPDEGIIALLGYPAKPPAIQKHQYQNHDLIYIDMHGKSILLNLKEVLDALSLHQDKERYVPRPVDRGEECAIQSLVDAIKGWLANQAVEEEKQEDGSNKKRMGTEAKAMLAGLKSGDAAAIKKVKQNIKVSDKYKADNFDLIAWFLVS